MDAKDAETQRKMKALAGYIEKKLAQGAAPKALYEDLCGRKVPHQLAVEMIERARKTGKALEGERDASLRQAAPRAESEAERTVAPTLPEAAGTSALTSIENPKRVVGYVVEKLAVGTEQKALVDELSALGMGRNEAIDVVVSTSEKLRAEVAGPTAKMREDDRRSARNKMLLGGALFFGGGCITVGSYLAADVGSSYWIFYGPIIYGLVVGIQGVVQWMRLG